VKKRKLYMDIDGVLVTWDSEFNCIKLAHGFGRLLRFCQIHEIQFCWLTMWSANPVALKGLGRLLWPDICPTMAKPEILTFDGDFKAEAIDFEW